jgi:DNA-binding HxlR family transcriptional regulator
MQPGGAAEAVSQALDIIQGRWKIELLFWLFKYEAIRYSDFTRLIPDLSQRVLTKQLKALEEDGMVLRTVYPTVPPQVDYRLTEKGRMLQAALAALRNWQKLYAA